MHFMAYSGGPHYMRSLYLLISVLKNGLFLEPILSFTVIVGLFICEFIIFEHIFGVPISRIQRGTPV